MNYYRICKYPSECRRNGSYYTAEWTSFSDIGRTFDGAVLTVREYERVETNYLLFLLRVWEMCGAPLLEVKGHEAYTDDLPWENGMCLGRNEIESICRDILREKFWCRLDGEHMRVHFGYDFYMHIGCGLTLDEIRRMASDYGLTVDEWHEQIFEEDE